MRKRKERRRRKRKSESERDEMSKSPQTAEPPSETGLLPSVWPWNVRSKKTIVSRALSKCEKVQRM